MSANATWRRRWGQRAVCAIFAGLVASPAIAAAPDIAVALTDDTIEVDAGFSGARLTLFGAVTGLENALAPIDIVTVIRGPDARFQLRKLENKNHIWIAGDPVTIDGAPGLYITAATNPIDDIAPTPDQHRFALHTDHMDASLPVAAADPAIAKAFVDQARTLGLYRDNAGKISFEKGALFTVKLNLPANTPVGDYGVSVYLYRDGELLGEDAATLSVNKVGLERRIYELAHAQPVGYGVICVALSLFAGWIAALAFRK